MYVYIILEITYHGFTFYLKMSKLKMENKIGKIKTYLGPWTTKPVISSTGIFVAIANNTLSFNTFDSGQNGLFFFYAKNHYDIK